jgi:gluconate 2-dehydrogenase gamma chain
LMLWIRRRGSECAGSVGTGSEAPLSHEARLTLAAVLARLIPSEPGSPGATEARLLEFVEAELQGDLRDLASGYEANLRTLDRFAATSHSSFAELETVAQDDLLRRLERDELDGFEPSAACFFDLLVRNAIEGMFGDPGRQGNAGFVGWDLIGYPGVRLCWSAEDQQLDVEIPLAHQSSADAARVAASEAARSPLV